MKLSLIKKILIFALIVVMLGFSSCSTIPQTGTVTVTISENFPLIKAEITKNYYIYVDEIYKGMSINLEPLTLENIPVGNHTFEAFNYMLAEDSINLKKYRELADDGNAKVIPYSCSGVVTAEIAAGVNYVNIPVFCYSIIEVM